MAPAGRNLLPLKQTGWPSLVQQVSRERPAAMRHCCHHQQVAPLSLCLSRPLFSLCKLQITSSFCRCVVLLAVSGRLWCPVMKGWFFPERNHRRFSYTHYGVKSVSQIMKNGRLFEFGRLYVSVPIWHKVVQLKWLTSIAAFPLLLELRQTYIAQLQCRNENTNVSEKSSQIWQ